MAAGITELSDLQDYIQKEKRKEKDLGYVSSIYTRNTPKRMADLLEGGSVFNIMRSMILCRRRILDIREKKRADGWTEIVLEAKLMRVMPLAHKPFQGWRYLEPARAPADLGFYVGDGDDEAPPEEMAADLRIAGLL